MVGSAGGTVPHATGGRVLGTARPGISRWSLPVPRRRHLAQIEEARNKPVSRYRSVANVAVCAGLGDPGNLRAGPGLINGRPTVEGSIARLLRSQPQPACPLWYISVVQLEPHEPGGVEPHHAAALAVGCGHGRPN